MLWWDGLFKETVKRRCILNWSSKTFKGGTSGKTIKHSILCNEKGLIVACLYILPNGNLHGDSWLSLEGWGANP